MASLWHETVTPASTGKTLQGDLRTEVLVIGGGMAGLLCAYTLKQAGVDCVVVEAGRIGQGTTGNTTAKITAQHAAVYADLLRTMGREKAQAYFEANSRAVARFKELARTIPCDLEEKDAFIYSAADLKKLEREAGAYERLGISGELVQAAPVPVEHLAALRMPGQAQFHPLKFLYGLAESLDIYEHAFIEKVDPDGARVRGGGRIRARHIVLCTHYPLVNVPGLYFMKMNQERSYVVAVENGMDVQGMHIGVDRDGYSFRNYGPYLLIGGGNHVTGRKGPGYRAPLELAEKIFPGNAPRFAWAAQDCMSLDRAPYIGRYRKGRGTLYLASGFNKWGMTGTMVAAGLLGELITTGKATYEDVFLPTRSMFHAKLASNMLHAAAGMIGFRKRCPHLGCALRWNEQEQSWDCPCHGSRFDADTGRVLDNPAKRGIKPGRP